jgi:hypothetical protein
MKPTNPELLLRVADLIEARADEYDQTTFLNWNNVGALGIARHRHTCGAPRCVAGWILTCSLPLTVPRLGRT